MAGGPSVKITKGEIRQIVRAADGADKTCAIGPAVGAEPFTGIDLGTSVKPLHRGADGRAGGRHRAVGNGLAGIHHRINDLGIAGTAAQNAAQRILDCLPVRCRVAAQQGGRRHHHAGGADATLRRAMAQKRSLQRRQGPVLTGKRLGGFNLPSGDLAGRHQTGADGVAIQKHCAGAAITGIAANLSGAKRQHLAQHLAQPHRWRAGDIAHLTIDRKAYAPVAIMQSVHHPLFPHNLPTSLATISAAATRR